MCEQKTPKNRGRLSLGFEQEGKFNGLREGRQGQGSGYGRVVNLFSGCSDCGGQRALGPLWVTTNLTGSRITRMSSLWVFQQGRVQQG